jgi:hypothetical protein
MIEPVLAEVLPKPVWKAFRTSAMASEQAVTTTIAPTRAS